MKRLLAGLLAFLLPLQAFAMMTINGDLGQRILPKRVVTIVGVIDEAMAASVAIQLRNTRIMDAPIVVDIESPGGSVEEGRKIIKMLEHERSLTRGKLVCVVEHAAHSMAFAILTHCDVRLATKDSTMVVHKVALGGDPGVRMSAKNLRRLADEMDKDDEPMAEENRVAMHLSRKDYDKYADVERQWTAKELLAMHYLDGIVTVSE